MLDTLFGGPEPSVTLLGRRLLGEHLSLAEKAVQDYVSSVLRKLEVGRRAEAAAHLARHTQNKG